MRSITRHSIPDDHPAAVFYDHWQANIASDGLFHRASFQPETHPKLLPWVLIVAPGVIDPVSNLEIIADGDNDTAREQGIPAFVYRLCGTGYTSIVGADLTGQRVGYRVPGEAGEESDAFVGRVLRDNKPEITQMALPVQGRDFIQVYRCACPVSKAGAGVDQVMGVVAPIDLRLY